MHHGSLEGQIFACPVKALERQAAHIRVHTSDGTKLVYAYWDSVDRSNVTDKDMRFHMEFAAEKVGYPSSNIPLDSIYAHSNWVGGECEMKLARFDDESIRKMGRWMSSSNDFLEYIQQNISGLSQSMASKMSRIEVFKNMEGLAKHKGVRISYSVQGEEIS